MEPSNSEGGQELCVASILKLLRHFPNPKVAHPMPQGRTNRRTTIEDVRYYTTKSMNGGTTFKCTFCELSVTTLDFNSMNGNRRTQAAAVINQHAASLHLRTPVLAKLGGRGAL